jgi:hypothetical protein
MHKQSLMIAQSKKVNLMFRDNECFNRGSAVGLKCNTCLSCSKSNSEETIEIGGGAITHELLKRGFP